VEEKLSNARGKGEKPWARLAGGLNHLHKETARIDGIIQKEFESVDPEDWK
jgi:hypothetical protein